MILTGWYPSLLEPLNGIFVKDQLGLLRNYGVRTDLVYADLNIRYLMHGFINTRKSTTVSENGDKNYFLRGPFWPKNNSVGFKRWVKAYAAWVKLYLVKEGLPDVIWTHTYLAAIVCHQLNLKKTPWLSSLHFTGWVDNSIKPLHKKMAYTAIQQSNGVFAVSKHLQKVLEKNHSIIADVLPNFVDDEKFKPRVFSSPKSSFNVLAVGDLIERKNWIDLIEIFSGVHQRIPNAELTVIGQGPLENEVRKRVRQLNVNSAVNFKGYVNRTKIPQYFEIADIFIHTSLLETYGIVFIESLLSGVPVVAYESGPVHEIISDAQFGNIIKPGDKKSFIEAVVSHSGKENKTSKHIRIKAQKKFGHKQAIEKLLQKVCSVLG